MTPRPTAIPHYKGKGLAARGPCLVSLLWPAATRYSLPHTLAERARVPTLTYLDIDSNEFRWSRPLAPTLGHGRNRNSVLGRWRRRYCRERNRPRRQTGWAWAIGLRDSSRGWWQR